MQLIPTVYLIRHATPDWSRTDLVYHLPPGPPLTPQGEGEARELGQFLWEAGVATIYASPLERAYRTAEIAVSVGQAAQVPVTISPSIAEGRPEEKAEDVRARLWPTWEHAAALSAQTGPVALVTHGGPIAVLLKELGLPEKEIDQYKRQFDRNNPLPPAGVWRATRLPGSPAWSLSLSFVPERHKGAVGVGVSYM